MPSTIFYRYVLISISTVISTCRKAWYRVHNIFKFYSNSRTNFQQKLQSKHTGYLSRSAILLRMNNDLLRMLIEFLQSGSSLSQLSSAYVYILSLIEKYRSMTCPARLQKTINTLFRFYIYCPYFASNWSQNHPESSFKFTLISIDNYNYNCIKLKMVKGYDPTKDDPSRIAVDYLFGIFMRQSTFTISKAQYYIKEWLESPKYIYIMKQVKKFDGKLPKINIKQSCWNIRKILSAFPSKTDQNFPAYTQQKDNQIVLCLDGIRNKIELKQNLDRQLYYLHYLKTKPHIHRQQNGGKQTNQEQNKLLNQTKIISNENDYFEMEAIYTGCIQSYKNYMFDESLMKKMAKKCTKYLFWRRSSRQLPKDSMFRFTSKLAQQVCI